MKTEGSGGVSSSTPLMDDVSLSSSVSKTAEANTPHWSRWIFIFFFFPHSWGIGGRFLVCSGFHNKIP